MKRVLVLFAVIFALSGFVCAASSEMITNFVVDAPKKEVTNYVPPSSFMSGVDYFILIFVVLAVAYFIVREKSLVKRKGIRRKVSKKKGVWKKK